MFYKMDSAPFPFSVEAITTIGWCDRCTFSTQQQPKCEWDKYDLHTMLHPGG